MFSFAQVVNFNSSVRSSYSNLLSAVGSSYFIVTIPMHNILHYLFSTTYDFPICMKQNESLELIDVAVKRSFHSATSSFGKVLFQAFGIFGACVVCGFFFQFFGELGKRDRVCQLDRGCPALYEIPLLVPFVRLASLTLYVIVGRNYISANSWGRPSLRGRPAYTFLSATTAHVVRQSSAKTGPGRFKCLKEHFRVTDGHLVLKWGSQRTVLVHGRAVNFKFCKVLMILSVAANPPWDWTKNGWRQDSLTEDKLYPGPNCSVFFLSSLSPSLLSLSFSFARSKTFQ